MTNKLKSFSATPGSNTAAPPFGWPEGMSPSAVNDTARQDRASLREWYEDAEWRDLGHAVLTVAGQVITITGSLLAFYGVGRAIRVNGTLVGTITASSIVTGNTAVTVEGFTPPGSITQIELGLTLDTVRQITRNAGSAQIDASGALVVTSPTSATQSITCNNTSTLTTAVQGAQIQMINNPATAGAGVTGISAIGRTAGAQSITNVAGMVGQGYTQGSGNVSNLFGVRGVLTHQASAGTVSSAISMQAGVPTYSGSGYTVTNAYGLRIEAQYNATFAPTSWGLYQVGALDRNYMQGRLLLGTTTDDGSSQLQVNGAVNIGASPLTDPLSVNGSNATVYTPTSASLAAPAGTISSIRNGSLTNGGFSGIRFDAVHAAGSTSLSYIGAFSNAGNNSATTVFGRRTGGTAYAEDMRISAAGNLLVGGTTDSGSTLQVTGAADVSGTINANGGTIATTAATANLLNAAATTVNFAGAATALTVGAATGTMTLRNPTIVGVSTTQALFNTVATTLSLGGAATSIVAGASGASLTFGALPAFLTRAWVNFNGATATVLAGGNVSSVVRNSAGLFTVNFTTALADANYAWSGSARDDTTNGDVTIGQGSAYTKTASALQIRTWDAGNNFVDSTNVSVTVHR